MRRTPEATFTEIWRSKLEWGSFASYVPGENLRVDEAARTLSGGKRLLDIGCGAGMLGCAVNRKYEEIYGVDIADEAVRLAKENGVRASQVDLNRESLPFEADFFDAVTALSVLPYVYDPEHTLRECHRVLRQGGELLLSVANMRTVGKLFQLFIRGRFPQTAKGYNIGYDGGAIHYFCYKDIKDLLVRAGFVVISRKGIFFRPRLLEKLPDKLVHLGAFKAEFLGGEIFVRALK